MNEYLNDAEMTALEASDEPQIGRLVAIVRNLSAALLHDEMVKLGAKYLGDSNALGLDFALWKAVIEAPVRLTDEEAAHLERLSQQAGGWWKLGTDEEFMDLGSWAEYYISFSETAM